MSSNKYIAAYLARRACDLAPSEQITTDDSGSAAEKTEGDPASTSLTDPDGTALASTDSEPSPLPEPPKAESFPPPASETPRHARVEFTSSNIRAATLGADGILFVEFASGHTFAYANFTEVLFAEWQAAKSAGGWFHQNVRSKPDRHPPVEAQKG